MKQLPITSYEHEIGVEFLPFASYSYCSEAQMTEGQCCSDKISNDYKLELSGTVGKDNYTFAILKNDLKKRVVITFTGTKGMDQLLSEFNHSYMVSYGDASKKMFILSYFNIIFNQVKEKIKFKLLEFKIKFKSYQYIFTGHSLGGALATIFALDSVLDDYVIKNSYSPALITYGSPKVGNFVFASHVMYYVPVIFRIVNDKDIVAKSPPCDDLISCTNKLGIKNFSNDIKSFTGPNIPIDKNYWHIAGMILYKSKTTEFTNCGKEYSESNPNKKCRVKLSFNKDHHSFYMSFQLSKFCRPSKKIKK